MFILLYLTDKEALQWNISKLRVYCEALQALHSTATGTCSACSALQLAWSLLMKEQYIDSITNAAGALTFPEFATFVTTFKEALKPAGKTGNAIHKLLLLKQGNHLVA